MRQKVASNNIKYKTCLHTDFLVHSRESLGIVRIASLPKERALAHFVQRTSKCLLLVMGLLIPSFSGSSPPSKGQDLLKTAATAYVNFGDSFALAGRS